MKDKPAKSGNPRFLKKLAAEKILWHVVGNSRESYRQLYYADSLTADAKLTAIQNIKGLEDVHCQDVLAVKSSPPDTKLADDFDFTDNEIMPESIFNTICAWTKMLTHQVALCHVEEKLTVFARQDIPFVDTNAGLYAGQLAWGDEQKALSVCLDPYQGTFLYDSKKTGVGGAFQYHADKRVNIKNIFGFFSHAPSAESLKQYWLDPRIIDQVATASMEFFNSLLETHKTKLPIASVRQTADIRKGCGIYINYSETWNQHLSRHGICAPLYYKDSRATRISSDLYVAPITIEILSTKDKSVILELSGSERRALLNNEISKNSGTVDIINKSDNFIVSIDRAKIIALLKTVKSEFGFAEYKGSVRIREMIPVIKSPLLYPDSPLRAAAEDLGLKLRLAAANQQTSLLDFALLLVHVKNKDKNLINQAGDKSGKTALHWAVETRQTSKVNALIAAQADQNLPDHSGNTPLILAEKMQYPEIIALLKLDPRLSSEKLKF